MALLSGCSDDDDRSDKDNGRETARLTWNGEAASVGCVSGGTENKSGGSLRFQFVPEEKPTVSIEVTNVGDDPDGDYTLNDNDTTNDFSGQVYARGLWGDPLELISGNLKVRNYGGNRYEITFEAIDENGDIISGDFSGILSFALDSPSYGEWSKYIEDFHYNDKVAMFDHNYFSVKDDMAGDKFSAKFVFKDATTIKFYIFDAHGNAEGKFVLGDGKVRGTFWAEAYGPILTAQTLFKSGTLELERGPVGYNGRYFDIRYNLEAINGDIFTGHYNGQI